MGGRHAPARPVGVPAEATWESGHREWVVCPVDDQGRKHGDATWWRPDGSLLAREVYVHGVAHGPFTRYHETGEVSRRGEMVEDRMHGVVPSFRPGGWTTEQVFPADFVADSVVRFDMMMEHGRQVATRCYDAAGNEVSYDGKPLRDQGVEQDHDADDDVATTRTTILYGTDCAAAWLIELDDEPRLATIERAVKRVLRAGKRTYLDVDDGEAAVAAAGVIAQLVDGKSGPLGKRMRERLGAALGRRTAAQRRALARDALAALEIAVSDVDRSELAERWADTEAPERASWRGAVSRLRRRVAAAARARR